jgi:hypothetical protein
MTFALQDEADDQYESESDVEDKIDSNFEDEVSFWLHTEQIPSACSSIGYTQ